MIYHVAVHGSLHMGTYTVVRQLKTKLNSVALVRERTIPTERPPPVGEDSARKQIKTALGNRYADHVTPLYLQKLALLSDKDKETFRTMVDGINECKVL